VTTAPRASAAQAARFSLLPRAAAPGPGSALRLPSVVLVASFSLTVGVALPFVVREPLALIAALGLVGLVAVAAVAAVLTRRRARRRSRSGSGLVVDARGLSIVRDLDARLLVPFSSAFGVTLLTSARRDRVVVAFTSPHRTVCVGAESGSVSRAHASLLHHAVALPTEDLRLACLLPDGEPLELEARALWNLIDVIRGTHPVALQRCYLTDARGEQIAVEGSTVRAGPRTFDLSAPFEWRVSRFREHAGPMDTCFEATWLRQDHDEIAFVSLVRGDERTSLHDVLAEPVARGDPSLVRDARLASARLGPPPPRHARVAIDRLFMLPLRRVLDQAAAPRSGRISDA